MSKNIVQKITNSLKTRGFNKTLNLSLYYGKRYTKIAAKKTSDELRFYYIKKNSVDNYILKKVQGSRMFLNLNDLGISKELALYGCHEYNSTEFIKGEIKPNMKVLEIGANIGYYTLLEAQIIGAGGHIYAFEPNPDNFHILKLNIELNGLENNASLYPYAMGDESKDASFFLATSGNLSSMVKREDGLVGYREVKTKVYKVDDIMADKPFDYFRMDVEGYEVEIIKGMQNILSSDKAPHGMFIEVHSELLHKNNHSAEQFITDLRKYGYEIKRSFYRGRTKISVNSTDEFLNHPSREKGYWETFFSKN